MAEPAVKRRGPPPRWAAWAGLLAVLPVAGWVMVFGQQVVRADWVSMAERQQVVAWASGAAAAPSDEALAKAQAAIARSLAISPQDPAMQERMGDVHFVAARQAWAREPERHARLQTAEQHYRQALALRPSEPQTWAMLATVLQGRDAPRAEVHQAWRQALALGPQEGHVRPVLLRLVLADWDQTPPDMQDWAKALFDQGDKSTRQAVNAMAKPYGLQFSADAASAP